eukprot:1682396-Amphidinium_carterae.1
MLEEDLDAVEACIDGVYSTNPSWFPLTPDMDVLSKTKWTAPAIPNGHHHIVKHELEQQPQLTSRLRERPPCSQITNTCENT